MTKNKWIERNGRVFLKDVLPLSTPFSVQIEPTRRCNFRCTYCIQSTSDVAKGLEDLSLDTFRKFCEGMKLFPNKLKTIIFCGFGEPLLNKDLAEMIKLSKEIANETVLITNGALLTEKKGQELIDAGLNVLRISMQGLNSDDYFKICGAKLDFDKFVANIKSFYDNKKQCKVFLKVPDISIDSEERKGKFYKIFTNISDEILVQVISPIEDTIVEYKGLKNNCEKTVYNEDITGKPDICSQPFFTMLLGTDGLVRPCCILGKVVGDIKKESIYDIWNGKTMTNLRIAFLKKQGDKIPVCSTCKQPLYTNNKYDNIDSAAEELLQKY